MKPNDFDLTMYGVDVQSLINDLAGPLVAFSDKDALSAIVGYIQVFAAQTVANGGYNLIVNDEAIQHFILHAQRAGLLDVEFLDASFDSQVRTQVPQSPPIAPDTLTVTALGSGEISATSSIGSSADRYDLQIKETGQPWTLLKQGTIGETDVVYSATGITPGTCKFRVVPRIGFFAGFPSEEQEITVT